MRHRSSVWACFCAGVLGCTGWIHSGISAPVNDDFLDAIVITGASTNVLGSNVDATSEVGEPPHFVESPKVSVWWRWVAPAAGEVTINTFGSSFDTVLAVHTGTALTNLLELVGNDDSGEGLQMQSEVSFSATEGVTYHIAVDGIGFETGNISLTLVETPPNDNFAARKALGSFDAGNNVGATPESGEPNHAGHTANASVWWTWTAPATQNYELTLLDSDFGLDTVLAVYTGAELTNLTEIATNDDCGTELYSCVIFSASSGTVYQIAVDGKSPTPTGAIFVTILPSTVVAPSNDAFASREQVLGFTSVTGTTVNATAEPGEPQHVVPDSAFASIWWTWTAPTNANVDIDTFTSDFNTQLAVYTGTELTNLTKIASNGDFGTGTQSRVTINALSNVTYQIAVDGDQITGSENATGTVVLIVSPGPAGPLNDHFAGAIGLSGLPTNAIGNNVNATFENGEPNHDDPRAADSSVWWSWTAPASTVIRVDTFGSSFDTVLAIYTGDTLNAFTQIASNNKADAETSQSRVNFPAQSGVVYHIAVDGHFGAEGNIALNISEIPNPDVGAFESSISNSFNFSWTSEDNGTYELMYSTNLVSWALLTNLVSTSATSQIIIADPGHDSAFFHVRTGL